MPTATSLRTFQELVDATKAHFKDHEWYAEDDEMTIGRAVAFMTSPDQLTTPEVMVVGDDLGLRGSRSAYRTQIQMRLLALLMADPALVAKSRERTVLDPAHGCP